MNCGWVKNNLVLYLYRELDDPERMEVEHHLERCEACRAEVEQERRLHQVLNARASATVDPTLLASCRIHLSEALETEPVRGSLRARLWARAGSFRPRWRPALASALLLLAGFGGGWVLSAHRDRLPASFASALPGAPAEANFANITSISAIRPDPSGRLRIEFETTRHRVLEGAADDPQIEQLLVLAARSYSNPGIRLDSIEVMKGRAADNDVKQALISALRSDRNPGVRLKALEALKSVTADEHVKQALLDVLRGDTNPGVRIEAINQLSSIQDRAAVPLLQQLAAGDPNNYVRIRSASALRQMNAPEIF